MLPQKACIGLMEFCAIYKHFAERDFKFSLLPGRVHTSPAVGNVSRPFQRLL